LKALRAGTWEAWHNQDHVVLFLVANMLFLPDNATTLLWSHKLFLVVFSVCLYSCVLVGFFVCFLFVWAFYPFSSSNKNYGKSLSPLKKLSAAQGGDRQWNLNLNERPHGENSC
jgi:hypothetical protein